MTDGKEPPKKKGVEIIRAPGGYIDVFATAEANLRPLADAFQNVLNEKGVEATLAALKAEYEKKHGHSMGTMEEALLRRSLIKQKKKK